MKEVHNLHVIKFYYKQNPDSGVWSFRCTDNDGELVSGDLIKEEAGTIFKKVNPDK